MKAYEIDQQILLGEGALERLLAAVARKIRGRVGVVKDIYTRQGANVPSVVVSFAKTSSRGKDFEFTFLASELAKLEEWSGCGEGRA